jgi:sulfate permease, SulP family
MARDQRARQALRLLAGWVRSVRPERRHLRSDLLAGLSGSVAGVTDGMAAAVLAGVSPVYGLYASFTGRIAGGLTVSTRLMMVTTTSAAALAAGSALQAVEPADRPEALFLLTLIAGAVMVVAGVVHLGRYTRFVSYSVMLGFLTGVAVNIVFSQLTHLTGADATGSIPLAKAIGVLTNPTGIHPWSLLVGLFALAILALLARTRWAAAGALMALAAPTLLVVLAGLDGVAKVRDVGEIPQGLPLPHVPDLGMLSFGLVSGALAVATIVLVQGAGVREATAHENGVPSDVNRDFIAQGVGNLAAGLFRGQPVGGSVGQTALNVAAGARSRWAAISSGIWLLLILVAFSGAIGQVAMPTLAAVLVFAGIGAVRPAEIVTILRTGPISQIAVITTFLATLFLPVAAAVGIGVALSLLLQLNQEAMDLAVVELVPQDDGRFKERSGPRTLASGRVTILDVYGSLFYAGARTLQSRLPDPAGAEAPVVVLRLRGRTSLGATFFMVIADYTRRLRAVDGRLYLSGVDHDLAARLRRAGRVDVADPIPMIEATSLVGESTHQAYADAEAWLVEHRGS